VKKKWKKKRKNWFRTLLSYADGREHRMWLSVILSIVSIVSGLIPFYCVYRMVDAYMAGSLENSVIIFWGAIGALAYTVKVVCFGFSTGLSHYVAYYVLEGLRLKIAEAFLKASLGDVQAHSIGEIKNVIVDRIEEIEPPLAHMIPEGSVEEGLSGVFSGERHRHCAQFHYHRTLYPGKYGNADDRCLCRRIFEFFLYFYPAFCHTPLWCIDLPGGCPAVLSLLISHFKVQ